MTWFTKTSPIFPSNLGMSKGILVGMVDQVVSRAMGSLMSFVKSIKLSYAMYGRWGYCGGGGGFSICGMCGCLKCDGINDTDWGKRK